MLKKCSKCEEVLKLCFFHKDAAQSSGYSSKCKWCKNNGDSRKVVRPVAEGVKVCTKCGEEKSVTEFHVQSRKPDGRYPSCKVCRRGGGVG